MPLATGGRLGPYEITGVLGVGGMGEVYRARDPTLGRDVALKVLPAEVASDKERVARFAREARTLASLNHPNIGTIHGWESSASGQAIVLELVEGPTLRDLIAAGPLPLEEALGIARQIADAVEAAHEQGIVHRDLKPANIKIRPDGRVKVLDFGLAKAYAAADGPGGDAATTMATATGVVLGTPAYMSPEQTRGLPVTRTTDVWSFGVVLFEMLAGRHPFGRGHSTEMMAAILRATPEWEALPAGTQPAVRRLLRRCLEKDPRSRVHDIGDVRLEIEDAISERSTSPFEASAAAGVGAPRAWSRGTRMTAAIAALVVIGAAIAAAYVFGGRRSPASPAMVRLSIVPPLGTRVQNTPSVSPDGTMVAFVATSQGGPRQLWIRLLAAQAPRVLKGTDGATFPFWSPDSRSLGFFADGRLKRIDAAGDNQPFVICDAKAGRGGTWLDDGSIVFTPESYGPLARVPASGGQPVAFTAVNTADGELDHRFPARVPGGYLLYLVLKKTEQASGVRLVNVNAPNSVLRFYQGISAAEYNDGFLLFVKDAQLVAQRIHLPDGELTGEVAQMGAVRTSETSGRYFWSSSPSALILPGPLDPPVGQFTWLGHDGRILGTVGQPDTYLAVELSPDGQRLVTLHQPGGRLSVLDTARGVPSSSGVAALHPMWSSDGSRLAYMTLPGAPPAPGVVRLVSAPWAGGGTSETLHGDTNQWLQPVGWTPDGTFAWIEGGTGTTELNIWQMPAGHSARAKPYLEGAGRNPEARLSRDGHWIAYASDQSGDFDIIVQRFPSRDQRYTASSHGGRFPRWSADGRELFYLSRDFGQLMAVSMTGDPPAFGTPHELFQVKLVPIPIDPIVFSSYEYDVDSRNARFIVNQLISEPVQTLDVVLNWNRK